MIDLIKKKKTILIVVVLAAIVVSGFVFLRPGVPEPGVPEVGHIHMTSGGGFRDTMATFVTEQFDVPVSFYATGSGDLRDYMTLALERGSTERGTLFTYTHRQTHQQFEAARPFIAAFPDRFPLRPEFAELADPKGELHVVWVDAYVIIYNPDLISRQEVPSTWEELSNFDQEVGVSTSGCFGTWGTMALYHHLEEGDFKRLMANAAVTGSQGDVTIAVNEGTIAVGISSLMNVMVRDGEVGVIWPEDGAIAKPAYMVIPDDPTEYHLRLADILFSAEAAELYQEEFNMISARIGGPAPTIVEENDFNLNFIPAKAIICEATEAKVDQIIGS